MTYPFSPAHPLWLLGCGNMAGAMLARWLETGLDPASVTIIDPHRTDAPAGVRLLAAPPQGEAPPAAWLLGIKPQNFHEASAGLPVRGATVISIMAGVENASLAARLPDAGAIVRLMPNLPVALGKGVALLHAGKGDARAMAEALAIPLGLSMWLESEALFDAGTAVSGSGPAFVYRFIDAMASGAQKLGFAQDQAQALALATVEGAAALASASPDTPAQLADRVASPGGTTRAGLNVLDENEAIYTLIHHTLKAATDRAGALAEELRRT